MAKKTTAKNILVGENEIKKFVERTKPVEALSEIIWNSLDANSTKVSINIKRDQFENIQKVTVVDDGDGMELKELEAKFLSWGESEKASSQMDASSQKVHGKIGKGRFKGYRLGDSVEWISSKNKKDFCTVKGTYSDPKKFVLDSTEVEKKFVGTRFTAINSWQKDIKLPDSLKLTETLEAAFAPKLLAKTDLVVKVDNYVLSPEKHIEKNIKVELSEFEDKAYGRIIIWNRGRLRDFFVCDSELNSLIQIDLNNKFYKDVSFSLFLSSTYLENLIRDGQSSLIEMDTLYLTLHNALVNKLRDEIYKYKEEQIAASISKIKEEGLYPYKGDAVSSVDKAERTVFDYCIHQVIDKVQGFEKSKGSNKKLTLGLIKQAIQTSGPEFEKVLSEVLNLTKDEVSELATLLHRSSLGNIIKLGKTVSDRMDFIHLLEKIVYEDDVKKVLKERAHLHKILEDSPWIFDETYSLSASDKTLENVLKRHIKDKERVYNFAPPTDISKFNEKMIPDLVLSRQVAGARADELDNLVVELKRPSKKITYEEESQIKKYATAIATDPQFDTTKTRWKFVVISSEIEPKYAEMIRINTDPIPGRIYNGQNLQIFFYTWSQLIQSAKGRMNFLKEHLNIEVTDDDTSEYFQTKYPHIFKEVEVAKKKATKKKVTKKKAAKKKAKKKSKKK